MMRRCHQINRAVALGLVATVMGVVFLLDGTRSSAAASSSEEARFLLQWMLGRAIMVDAFAKSAEDKARAQESLGFLIVMNKAVLDRDCDKARILLEGMLGRAIVGDARARTAVEKARAQETLGFLIANKAMLFPGS